jgi:DNA anti-recombination protein RmuC
MADVVTQGEIPDTRTLLVKLEALEKTQILFRDDMTRVPTAVQEATLNLRNLMEAKMELIDDRITAERRRSDDLSTQKKEYDKQISETQTTQLKTTSDLVSTQLDKVTTSLSDTINKTADNIAERLSTMDKRIAAVEQFRYETGGSQNRQTNSSATNIAIIAAIAAILLVLVDGATLIFRH